MKVQRLNNEASNLTVLKNYSNELLKRVQIFMSDHLLRVQFKQIYLCMFMYACVCMYQENGPTIMVNTLLE